MSNEIYLDFATFSDQGGREYNEDTIRADSDGTRYIFQMADGLGGQGNGEIASRIVTTAVADYYKSRGDDPGVLADAFAYAQNCIMNRKKSGIYGDMMSTLTVLDISPEAISCAHLGDSRLYMFQDGRLTFQTLDHSVPQALAAAGEIEPSEIRHHPDRNKLLRALGLEWNRDNETDQKDLGAPKGCQAFLLCSDGFWEMIDEDAMTEYLVKTDSPAAWLKAMVEYIRGRGKSSSMDNYSAVAVEVSTQL